MRYQQYPNLLVVGLLPRRDAVIEHLFTSVAERNAINMAPPAWTTGFITPEQSNVQLQAQLQSMLDNLGVTR